MKKIIILMASIALYANAHFLTFLPNSDHIQTQDESTMMFDIAFMHPFEQTGMTLEKPSAYVNNKTVPLKRTKQLEHQAWQGSVNLKTPGVYMLHATPQPYFEPSEEKFIVHVPKVIISAYGMENGWDKPLGLKYEIIPMVKPFGLYAGNLFQGRVLHNGEPASHVTVEVELYNEFGLKAPTDAHVTQEVKTDSKGVFSFVMNHKGWWGFAALIEEGESTHTNGKKYPVENGALLWLKAY